MLTVTENADCDPLTHSSTVAKFAQRIIAPTLYDDMDQ